MKTPTIFDGRGLFYFIRTIPQPAHSPKTIYMKIPPEKILILANAGPPQQREKKSS